MRARAGGVEGLNRTGKGFTDLDISVVIAGRGRGEGL